MSAYYDNKDGFLQPQVNQYNNSMVMTNVHKETRTKYWNIDTRFRDDYDQYSQTLTGGIVPWYTFTLPQPIHDVKTICVDNAEIPISFYNISDALGNNVIQVNSDLIVVSDGFYSSSIDLRTAMNTSLVASNMTFDISYNGNPYCSFTNTSGSDIVLDFAIQATSIGGEFDKFYVKSKLGWLLGFRNISYTVAAYSTLRSESILDLNCPRYLYLVMDEFTSSNTNSFISPLPTSIINKNILAKISMDYFHYPFGQIMTANPTNGFLTTDVRSYNGKVNLQKLKIQLVNEYGKPMHLNGLDFSFSLEITYE